MMTSNIGNTKLTKLGFGTFPFDKKTWHNLQTDEEVVQLLVEANNLGINYFNTALYYGAGRCEQLVGQAVNEMVRNEVIVCTKLGSSTIQGDFSLEPKDMEKDIESILRRMNLDHLDVVLLHGPDPKVKLEDCYGKLKSFKDQGIVKHIGLSNFSANEVISALKIAEVEVLEFYFSLLTQSGGARGRELLGVANKYSILTTPFRSIERGIMSDRFPGDPLVMELNELYESPYQEEENRKSLQKLHQELTSIADEMNIKLQQLALAWTIHQKGIDVPLVGMTKISEVKENLEAINMKLSAEQLEVIDDIIGRYEFKRSKMMITSKKD